MRSLRHILTAALAGAALLSGCDAAPHDDHEGDLEARGALFSEAYVEARDNKGDDVGCSGVRLPDATGFGGRVALTFDDGPVVGRTDAVLDALARHGAHATFFINGSRVTGPAQRALLQRMLDEGHEVANHSHAHHDMRKLTGAEAAAEIDRTHAVLTDAGVEPRWFRFPFGAATCGTVGLARERGYTVAGWHIDSADWCYASSSGEGEGICPPQLFRWVPDEWRTDMAGYTLHQIREAGGGVVLFHDIHRHTGDVLDGILSTLLAEGYTFVGLDDATAFPNLNAAPAPLPTADGPWIGTPCAVDDDCSGRAAAPSLCYRFGAADDAPIGDAGASTDAGGAAALVEYGFCSHPCEGPCPDREGFAASLCVAVGDSGLCAARAAAENDDCADIAGTAPAEADRHVGASGHRRFSAVVCLPR